VPNAHPSADAPTPAGKVVCMAPYAMVCPANMTLAADFVTCATCPAGHTLVTLTRFEASCSPPCPSGTLANGTCFTNCTDGTQLVGGRRATAPCPT
jgi:hypothetical protein